MGCCFSCFNGGDDKSQSGEPNERTTLLGNPVSNSISRPLFNQDFSDVISGQVADEQAALNKILHKTTVDIIDVSAIPTHIEQKDFVDRVTLYQRRLPSLRLRPALSEKCLIRDLSCPEKTLSENPILFADLQMVEDVFREAYTAFTAIQIVPQGDLVTNFGMS